VMRRPSRAMTFGLEFDRIGGFEKLGGGRGLRRRGRLVCRAIWLKLAARSMKSEMVTMPS